MSAKCSWLVSMLVLGLMSCGNTATAQIEADPASEVTGYAADRIRNIYRRDIGSGYSFFPDSATALTYVAT